MNALHAFAANPLHEPRREFEWPTYSDAEIDLLAAHIADEWERGAPPVVGWLHREQMYGDQDIGSLVLTAVQPYAEDARPAMDRIAARLKGRYLRERLQSISATEVGAILRAADMEDAA